MSDAAERIFYDNSGVKVTNARFIVSTTTYAVNNITSAKMRVRYPGRKGPIILGILGVIFLPTVPVLGLAVIAAAVFWWYQQKNLYLIVLATSGGEQEALTSQRREYVEEVYGALNSAIISRG